MEVGVMALQPMIVEDDMMVGFEQPSLSSLRCDMMKKTGELDREKVFLHQYLVDNKNCCFCLDFKIVKPLVKILWSSKQIFDRINKLKSINANHGKV